MIGWTTLELTRRSFQLHRQSLFGEQRFEYPLEAIERLEIASFGGSARQGQLIRYRVVPQMADGEAIPLTHYRMSSAEPPEQTREEIEVFLRERGECGEQSDES